MSTLRYHKRKFYFLINFMADSWQFRSNDRDYRATGFFYPVVFRAIVSPEPLEFRKEGWGDETRLEGEMTKAHNFRLKLPPPHHDARPEQDEHASGLHGSHEERHPDMTCIGQEDDIRDTKINGMREPEKIFSFHPLLSTVKDGKIILLYDFFVWSNRRGTFTVLTQFSKDY